MTDTILIDALPFVPMVKTFLASLPKTTCPILIGLGVVVIGFSFGARSSNSISSFINKSLLPAPKTSSSAVNTGS